MSDETKQPGKSKSQARHPSATLLIEGWVDPKTVSQRLGHANVKITLDTYTHPTSAMEAAASDELERVIGRRK
jgi:integrase